MSNGQVGAIHCPKAKSDFGPNVALKGECKHGVGFGDGLNEDSP